MQKAWYYIKKARAVWPPHLETILRYYEKAITIDPNYYLIYQDKARLFFAIGKFEESEENYNILKNIQGEVWEERIIKEMERNTKGGDNIIYPWEKVKEYFETRNEKSLETRAKIESNTEVENDYDEEHDVDVIDLSYFNKRRAQMLRNLAMTVANTDAGKSALDGVKDAWSKISIGAIEAEFDATIDKMVELSQTLEPPNKASMIAEFERIRHALGRVPTRQDIQDHSAVRLQQYEEEFRSWEHLLDRLGYDPWYRSSARNAGRPSAGTTAKNRQEDPDTFQSESWQHHEPISLREPQQGDGNTSGADMETHASQGDNMPLTSDEGTDRTESLVQEAMRIRAELSELRMHRVNLLIGKAMRLIKASQTGAHMSDLKSLLDLQQEEMSALATRLNRIDGITVTEIRRDGGLLDFLFTHNDESEAPPEDTADRGAEGLVRQMMEEHALNKRTIDSSLQKRLTREFIAAKSVAEVVRNNPDITKEQIKRHIRSPLRLPLKVRKLNEEGMHPDPMLSLQIALFAVNHHDWDGDEDAADDVLHTAESIARHIIESADTDVRTVPKGNKQQRANCHLEPVTASIAVWISTATLHREFGMDANFSSKDIVARTMDQNLCRVSHGTISAHVSAHCVANAPSSHGMHRMLYRVGHGRYRLYRRGEPCHRTREGSKIAPLEFQLPEGYKDLRKWYDEVYCKQ